MGSVVGNAAAAVVNAARAVAAASATAAMDVRIAKRAARAPKVLLPLKAPRLPSAKPGLRATTAVAAARAQSALHGRTRSAPRAWCSRLSTPFRCRSLKVARPKAKPATAAVGVGAVDATGAKAPPATARSRTWHWRPATATATATLKPRLLRQPRQPRLTQRLPKLPRPLNPAPSASVAAAVAVAATAIVMARVKCVLIKAPTTVPR